MCYMLYILLMIQFFMFNKIFFKVITFSWDLYLNRYTLPVPSIWTLNKQFVVNLNPVMPLVCLYSTNLSQSQSVSRRKKTLIWNKPVTPNFGEYTFVFWDKIWRKFLYWVWEHFGEYGPRFVFIRGLCGRAVKVSRFETTRPSLLGFETHER